MRTIKRVALLAFAVGAVSCAKKSDSGKSGNSAPQPTNVVPSTFKNTTDEAGFKTRLSQVSGVLQSSSQPFTLRAGDSTERKSDGAFKRVLNSWLKDREFGAYVERLSEEDALPGNLSNKLMAAKGKADTTETEDSSIYDQLQELKVGDSCNAFLTDVTNSYNEAARGFENLVSTIGQTDFSKSEGFSKDAVRGDSEAFAYKFRLESTKEEQGTTNQTQTGARGGKSSSAGLTDATFLATGRFAGGASDKAVTFNVEGDADWRSTDTAIKGALNSQNYVDLTAKRIDASFGVNVAGTQKDQSPKSLSLLVSARLQGGPTPSQRHEFTGDVIGAEDGNHKLNVVIELNRTNANTMRVSTNITMDGKSALTAAEMQIEPTAYGFETCTVKAIQKQ